MLTTECAAAFTARTTGVIRWLISSWLGCSACISDSRVRSFLRRVWSSVWAGSNAAAMSSDNNPDSRSAGWDR